MNVTDILFAKKLAGGGGGGSDVLVTPDYADLSYAYVVNGSFNSYSTKKYYVYIFPVSGGTNYTLAKTDTAGNAFHAAYFAGKTLADFEYGLTHGGSTATIYTGVAISDVSNNAATAVTYKPASDGVIAVQVSSQSQAAKMACVDMSKI